MPGRDASLIQLVYVSRRQANLRDEAVIDGIVFPALRFNRARDITGCIWVGKEHFVQVLEGSPDEVDPLYARIEQDTRHTSVTLLQREKVRQRDYERFAMQLIRGQESEEVAKVISKWSNGNAMIVSVADDDDPGRTSALEPVLRLATRVTRLLVGREAF